MNALQRIICASLVLGGHGLRHAAAGRRRRAQLALEINKANELLRGGDVDCGNPRLSQAASDHVPQRPDLSYNTGRSPISQGRLGGGRASFHSAAANDNDAFAAKARYNLGNCDYASALQLAERTAPRPSKPRIGDHQLSQFAGNRSHRRRRPRQHRARRPTHQQATPRAEARPTEATGTTTKTRRTARTKGTTTVESQQQQQDQHRKTTNRSRTSSNSSAVVSRKREEKRPVGNKRKTSSRTNLSRTTINQNKSNPRANSQTKRNRSEDERQAHNRQNQKDQQSQKDAARQQSQQPQPQPSQQQQATQKQSQPQNQNPPPQADEPSDKQGKQPPQGELSAAGTKIKSRTTKTSNRPRRSIRQSTAR